jgi:hypothetical protein
MTMRLEVTKMGHDHEVGWNQDGSMTMRLDGLRWVVPETMRSQIVFYHDNVGHFGTERILPISWAKVLVSATEEVYQGVCLAVYRV